MVYYGILWYIMVYYGMYGHQLLQLALDLLTRRRAAPCSSDRLAAQQVEFDVSTKAEGTVWHKCLASFVSNIDIEPRASDSLPPTVCDLVCHYKRSVSTASLSEPVPGNTPSNPRQASCPENSLRQVYVSFKSGHLPTVSSAPRSLCNSNGKSKGAAAFAVSPNCHVPTTNES